LLGDTSLANMAAIPPSVFTNSNVNLRVWFSPGSGNPFVQLAPDQRLGASGYALRAAAVDLPGENNTASGTFAVVGGGVQNAASGYIATIGGGVNNTASGSYAVVGGGETNTASGSRATIGGGSQNTATGSYATVPGGVRSFATNFGAFVWSGDVFEDTGSFGNNTFTVRAEGGARFYTANGTGTGVNLSAGAGAWNNLSDRGAKANFRKVDAIAVLGKVAAMPVMTWNYRTQDESIRHIGPTAQDFRAAFGLGENDKTISTIDPSGVALAAIQGLVEELKERDTKIEKLEAKSEEVDALKAKLQAFEERLNSLPPQ
ncbi:MAG: tail fiber domain-containing protein, partial [Chthoniobacterales bacterium]